MRCDIDELLPWRRIHQPCARHPTFQLCTTASVNIARVCRKHVGMALGAVLDPRLGRNLVLARLAREPTVRR